MQDDRKRIEQINAEIARYDRALQSREEPQPEKKKSALVERAAIAFVSTGVIASLCVFLFPYLSEVVGSKVHAAILCGVLILVGLCVGIFNPRISSENTAASRQLDRIEKQREAARRETVSMHRERLVRERAQIAERLEDQLGGGLSMTRDEEQRGGLSVSEDPSDAG